ncbi:hypothetical protein ACWCV2_17160 [Streptomyces pseudogriseolus]
MRYARISALAVPLSAAEQEQVQHAAEVAGQDVEEFMRTAVLEAASDPFLTALEQAADTVARRAEVQHDYAH